MQIKLGSSTPFKLDLTLCCGQAFRWKKQGDWWRGVVGEETCKVRQSGETLEFEGVDKGFVESYFRLDDDLPSILVQIDKDNYVRAAVKEFRGLRILRQEPWECLISFICATYKSISAISQMLTKISGKFGQGIRIDGQTFYAIPKPEKLAKAGLQELQGCGLGYRAKYVSETARIIQKNRLDFERLKKTTYEKAREELLNLPGVGPKVADCVQLFSLEKLEAFPVDVWIKRVILKYYAKHFPKEFIKKNSAQESLSSSAYDKFSSFGREYFGNHAGYAQEYLYHHERTHR